MDECITESLKWFVEAFELIDLLLCFSSTLRLWLHVLQVFFDVNLFCKWTYSILCRCLIDFTTKLQSHKNLRRYFSVIFRTISTQSSFFVRLLCLQESDSENTERRGCDYSASGVYERSAWLLFGFFEILHH